MTPTIEVWIKYKESQTGWTLYALPKNLEQAKAIVLARSQRDRKHDYEIREIPPPQPAEAEHELADNESSQFTPPV